MLVVFAEDKGKKLNSLSSAVQKQIFKEGFEYFQKHESARELLFQKPRRFLARAVPVRRIRHLIEMYGSINDAMLYNIAHVERNKYLDKVREEKGKVEEEDIENFRKEYNTKYVPPMRHERREKPSDFDDYKRIKGYSKYYAKIIDGKVSVINHLYKPMSVGVYYYYNLRSDEGAKNKVSSKQIISLVE